MVKTGISGTWHTTRASGLNRMGTEDIHRAIYQDARYIRVENLGDGVNKKTYEFNAFGSPDESYLVFSSQRREGEIGGSDICSVPFEPIN